MAAMFQTWKQAADSYLAAFGKMSAQFTESPVGDQTARETGKTYLGSRATLAELTRTAYEPLVEMAGGVTMSEFRRLMDLVYSLHLRLDRVDDALAGLRDQQNSTEPVEKRRKKKV
jgi:hypothetical protein